ncbi:MAG: phytoene/squalene synthase family protein, partial [Patescibacteria group bacterium]
MDKINIFRKGSTTYFFSSIFFPKDVRNDVFTLYAFVRTADDFVDIVPQNKQGFLDFKQITEKALNKELVNDRIIEDFVKLADKHSFIKDWIRAFLDVMESDMNIKSYASFSDLEKYIYGSAEVIGLMMAKIMGVPEDGFDAAKTLGKSMQLINFIRDIDEDLTLGRVYIPQEDIRKFGVEELNKKKSNEMSFADLMRYEISRYFKLVESAEKG